MRKIIFALFLLTACSHKPAHQSPLVAEIAPVQSACAAFGNSAFPKNFEDYDDDKSGSISRDEYLCQVVQHFTALNGDNDDYLERTEISVPLKSADENGDKKVSIVEFMHASEAAFDFADKNKSGDLSKDEFKAGNRKLP